MKTALVLCGGGAKGAYEVGCIRALQQLNIKIDIVCGTSIGALNGLLVVQQDYDALEKLWQEMSIEKVMVTPVLVPSDTFINNSNMLLSFFKQFVNEKGADITPLKNTVYPLFDVEKYKQSPIQYGLVTVKYPNLQGLELSDQDFEPSLAIHYALASASCFPVFPVYSIDQQAYIDGGYFDNLPISLALKMGAEHIIAIDLNQVPTHSHFTHRPNIQMILPSHDLGNFLDFNRDVLDQRIELGYLDTMKAFHQFRGYQYAFKKNKPINASLLYQIILQHEDQLNRTHTKHLKNNCPITSFLMRNCNQQIVSQEDYAILALECVLSYYDYSFIKCYDFHICAQEVYQLFMNHYGENRELYEKSHSRLSQIAETLRQFTSKQRIYYLFEELVTTKNLNIGITERFFEQEMIIALFMYCYSINQFK